MVQRPPQYSIEGVVGTHLISRLGRTVFLRQLARDLNLTTQQVSGAIQGLKGKGWGIAVIKRGEYRLNEVPESYKMEQVTGETGETGETTAAGGSERQRPAITKPGERLILMTVIAYSVRESRWSSANDMYVKDEEGNLYRATLIGKD